jgi:hypothetical protein
MFPLITYIKHKKYLNDYKKYKKACITKFIYVLLNAHLYVMIQFEPQRALKSSRG